jgi:hypothetical protein
MDATGPFNSISGTLMSIPFCIAVTLVHGTPTVTRMTTYDDAAVNGLVDRIAPISDADVSVLSAISEVDAAAQPAPALSAAIRRGGDLDRLPRPPPWTTVEALFCNENELPH